jgi:hypothetical protein
MKYISEILKQFTRQQKLFVLILLLVFICGTSIITTYLNSEQKSCHEVIELNKKYLKDLVDISKLIQKQKIEDIQEQLQTVADVPAEASPTNKKLTPIVRAHPNIRKSAVLDSILKISSKYEKFSNLKIH